MKKAVFLMMGLAAIVGCGGGEKTSQSTESVEVQAFQGGYGLDFYQAAAAEFSKESGTDVKVEGNPRVWEQLRPRFVAGNPPDLAYPGWGLDHWALAEEGQLMDLNEALDTKPYKGEGTWRETFEPAILKLGQLEGKQYVLPYFFNVLGWWYNPDVFAKNNWTVPQTWDELLTLCDKINAAGIAPITFQGQYPYYMIEGMLLPWVMSLGGAEAVRNCQNLEPGAWTSDSVLDAARMIAELRDRGFFQKGATALSHTESQQAFLQGRAAMIPCGTWLYAEMKDVMPPNAKMKFMLPPVVDHGMGEPTAIMISIEPWMVPSGAKNPQGGIDFFKYMTSLDKAKQFVEQKGTLMSIKGSDKAKLPEVLIEPAERFRTSKAVWSVQYRQWYTAFDTEMQNALTSMLNGEATPEQFCQRVEAAAQKTRNDNSIAKHKAE